MWGAPSETRPIVPIASCSSFCARSQSISCFGPPPTGAFTGSFTLKTCELPMMMRSLCFSAVTVPSSTCLPLTKTTPFCAMSSSTRLGPPSAGS